MRDCKAAGWDVCDHSFHVSGDEPGDDDRRFDSMAEVALRQIRELVHEIAEDPSKECAWVEMIDQIIRCTFQAQILYLRKSALRAAAIALFWSNPRRLTESPHLLAAFEEFIQAGHPGDYGKRMAAELIGDMLRKTLSGRF